MAYPRLPGDRPDISQGGYEAMAGLARGIFGGLAVHRIRNTAFFFVMVFFFLMSVVNGYEAIVEGGLQYLTQGFLFCHAFLVPNVLVVHVPIAGTTGIFGGHTVLQWAFFFVVFFFCVMCQ